MRLSSTQWGSLGDLFLWYFQRPGTDDGGYMPDAGQHGYLADLRRRRPDVEVVLWMCQTNPRAPELFAHHPGVAEVVYTPGNVDPLAIDPGFVAPGCDGRLAASGVLDGCAWADPPIYLDDREAADLDRIRAAGPYVAVHPFAGMPYRSWLGHLSIRAVLGRLAARVPIVVLGADHDRHETTARYAYRESTSFRHAACVHLVGSGLRLQAAACRHAAAFVGTLSAYQAIAMSLGKPSLVLTHPRVRDLIASERRGPHLLVGTTPRTAVRCFDECDHEAAGPVDEFLASLWPSPG